VTEQAPSISVSRIRRGIVAFIGLSIVGLIVVVYRSSLAETLEHLRGFDRRWLAAAAGLFVLDFLMAGTRIYLFARRVKPDISYWACVRSCFVNVFVGGVTPSQTGGGPAQIWVMHREGLSLIDSTVVCFVGGFLGTAFVLLLCAIFFGLFYQVEGAAVGLKVFSTVSLLLFSLVVVLVMLSLLSPNRFKRLVGAVTSRLPRLRRSLEKRGWLDRVYDTVDRYHELMRGFIVHSQGRFAVVVVLSALIYFNKFAVAWVVLRGLGLEAPFWDVIYMQVVLILIFYFSPTPGASGLAEVSTAAVMSVVVPTPYQAVFIVLWRFFTLVAGMLVGAVITLRYLYAAGRGESPR